METTVAKLSARKRAEYDAAKEAAIKAGVQFTQAIVKGERLSIPMNDEMKKGLHFLLVECVDKVPMGYEESYYLAKLGDPDKIENFNFKMFGFFQAFVKMLKVTGRENALKLYKAVDAFEKPGKVLKDLQNDQHTLANEYNRANARYGQVAQSFKVMPEELDNEIATRVKEWETKTFQTEEKNA